MMWLAKSCTRNHKIENMKKKL